jgi:cytosine/adenosine deaminase-related metal-dependent hydrolase
MRTHASTATSPIGVTRRDLISTAVVLGTAVAAVPRSAAGADLPSRGEFVIRNAHVLTMDQALGDLERADIHVRNGTIVAVGPDLAAPGAEVIDARSMIALPGLVDTHNHIWNSTCRNLVKEGPEKGYFATVLALGKQEWPSHSNEGLLTLGFAARVFSPKGLPSVHPMTLATAHRDWENVRALKLPITAHISGDVAFLEREAILGPDLQITGTRGMEGKDFEIIKSTGTHVSITPHSDMRYSYTLPKLIELLKLDVKVSLSVDTAPVAGSNDMFEAMRRTMDTQFVRSRNPMSMSARQVLEMATINGAWDMGVADKVGSLVPGKRADLILMRTTDLNMAPLGDSVTAAVRSAQPFNVDTVVIDGRILKRDGRLTALNAEEVVAQAADSLAGLRRRANWL